MATASTTQEHYRGRNDDGSESGATWKTAAADQNWTQDTGQIFRIRIAAAEVNGKTATINPTLYVQKNGGGYQLVGTSSSIVQLTTSGYVTDATVTVQRISSGTYVDGEIDDNGVVGNKSLNASRTEIEWVCTLVNGDVAEGDTLNFRCYNGSTPLNSYSVTPAVTVHVAAQNINENADQDKFLNIAGISEVNIQDITDLDKVKVISVDAFGTFEETLYDS